MTTRTSTVDAQSIVSVPLLDLKAQYASIRGEIESALLDVCESQHFVMGPKVQELEVAVAKYSGAGFGIGVSSGTDALLVALMALGVGSQDEVITTPFSFFATAGVIARLGARPVFCDVDPETYNISANAVKKFISRHCKRDGGQLINRNSGRRVSVLLPVHLFGQMADMTALTDIANDAGLKIVEDAAQAIGAEDGAGRRAGSIGDIGCLSFFPSKNLGGYGDGGMCVTRDQELAEKMQVLRVHGAKPKYHHAEVGGNFRLDAIQAAVLLVKLRQLDGWTVARQSNAKNYDELLARGGKVPRTPIVKKNFRHVFNQYTLRVDRRDELRAALIDAGVGCEIYYPIPLHLQECFKYLGYQEGDFPEAEAAAKSVISIPVYPELTQTQRQYVVSVINDHHSAG